MKRSSERTGVLAIVAVFATACSASPPKPAEPTRAQLEQRLPGCYAFFDRGGRPASDSLYWAPAIGQLASDGRAAKLTASPDSLRQWRENTWKVDSLSDTVRVLFHSGFSGTEFILGLRPRGDTLRGRAVAHWDMGPPFANEAGAARAVRVACPPG